MKIKVKNLILSLIILSFISASLKAENKSVINNINNKTKIYTNVVFGWVSSEWLEIVQSHKQQEALESNPSDFLLSGTSDSGRTAPGILASSLGDVLGDDEEDEDEDYADGYMTYTDVDQEFEQLLRNTEGVDINVIPPGGPSSLTNGSGVGEYNGVDDEVH